ncbi:MAG: hypothetical protein ACO1QS_18090 [Verrucomicrobiota bacterium]
MAQHFKEIPNPKRETPKKSQLPNSNANVLASELMLGVSLMFGALDLEFSPPERPGHELEMAFPQNMRGHFYGRWGDLPVASGG